MEKKFLTKNTKVTIQEEASPNGLKTYEKIHKEDATINNDALKAIGKKLEDYYGDELKQLDPVLKVDREQDSTGDVDVYDVEALGTGMQALKYDNEGSEVFKDLTKRMEELNDTSEYDKEFGTKDGFGDTDEKNDIYKKLEDASKEYIDNKYKGSNPEVATDRLRVTSESKNQKMKRLNFKNEFTSVEEVKELIPENYKVDGHTFLMTDGNQTYKVRWDDILNEGTILGYKNKLQINEDIEKMKKLYNYDYSDSMGKTNDYGVETKVFTTLMEKVNKKGELLTEQDDKYEDGETIKAVYNVGGNKLGFQLSTKVDKETKDRYPSHLHVSVNGKGKNILKPDYKIDADIHKALAQIKPSSKGSDSALSAFNKFKALATAKFPNVKFTELESALNNKNGNKGLPWIYSNYMSPQGEVVGAEYDKDGKVYKISGKAYPVIKGEGNVVTDTNKYGPLTITTSKGEKVTIPVQFQTAQMINKKGGLIGLSKKNKDTYTQLNNLLGNLESGGYAADVVNNLFTNLVG